MLIGGNYVGVSEVSGVKRGKFLKGAPVKLCWAPRAPAIKNLGALAHASSMAPASESVVPPEYLDILNNKSCIFVHMCMILVPEFPPNNAYTCIRVRNYRSRKFSFS